MWRGSAIAPGRASPMASPTRSRVSSPVHLLRHRSILRAFLLLGLAVGLTACDTSPGNPKVPAGAKSSGGLHATLETDKGPIELELLPDAAPRAVENFRLLAEHGYYDGLTFHRLVKGFMIQGG